MMRGATIFANPEQFLDHLVPRAIVAKPAELAGIHKGIKIEKDERHMCCFLVEALNAAPYLCPDFKFTKTSTGEGRSVICGLYLAKYAPRVQEGVSDQPKMIPEDSLNLTARYDAAGVDIYDDKRGKISSDRRAPPRNRVKLRVCSLQVDPPTNWSRVELAIVAQADTNMDPFEDDMESADNGQRRQAALRQLQACAQSIFKYQQRTHQYMVLICADTARLVYIDRAGMVVTTAFKYATDNDALVEFLWRFARMSPVDRGHDPTAERLDPDSLEAKKMRDRASRLSGPGDYVTQLFKDSLVPECPWYSLSLRDDESDAETKERRFLVGRPHFAAGGIGGRVTQGYVAMDRDDPDGRLLYLKDTWRVTRPGLRKEGDTIKFLNANNVPFVPTLVCYGGLGQSTITQDLWCSLKLTISPNDSPLVRHEHYRLVVREVGKPLASFGTGYGLAHAMYCCLRAHKAAYDLGILHRNISPGHVILVPKPKQIDQWIALLIDWELAEDLTSGTPEARQSYRTGTWQFLSANAQDNPEKQIALQDDLESVFHVLLYMAIRFLPHSCPRKEVGKLLCRFFDDTALSTNGEYGCGRLKARSMESGNISLNEGLSKDVLEFWLKEGRAGQKHPVEGLITTLLLWFKEYYASLDMGTGDESPETPSEDDDDEFMKFADLDGGGDVDVDREWPESCLVVAPPPASSRTTLLSITTNEFAEEPPEDTSLFQKLDSHEAVIELFRKYLTDLAVYRWPRRDKTEDKKPRKGYDSEDSDSEDETSVEEYVSSATIQSGKRSFSELGNPEMPSMPRKRPR